MHLDIILRLQSWTLGTLFGLLVLGLAYIPAGTQAYHVVLPDAATGTDTTTTKPIILDFSLLPVDAWTYAIRNVWRESGKSDLVTSLSNITGRPGVVWWDAARHSLAVDARAVFSLTTALTVIIEAKSATVMSIIPVTLHAAAKGGKKAAGMTTDYPHIVQQSSQACRTRHLGSSGSRRIPDIMLNISHAIPYFVRQSGCHITADRGNEEDDFLLIRDGSAWLAKHRLCEAGSGAFAQTAYHTVTVRYNVTGQPVTSQALDLIFPSDGSPYDASGLVVGHQDTTLLKVSNQAVKHRQRRHRKTRAAAIAFSAPSFTVSVLEELPPPVYVVRMNVTSNAKMVKFAMTALADSRSQALFSIDPESGVVRTETQLDREAISQHYFRITAVSETDKWTTATTTLHIKVLDINDNLPVFEKTDYNVTISESASIGSVVVTVHAGDSDEGGNGQVSYSLINSKGKNDAFQIDAKNGVISTRLPLDRETLENHLLYVKAEDGGLQSDDGGRDDQKKSSIAKILIKVTDENDNTPRINNTCSLAVREDLDWTSLPTIVQLQAIDEDHGLNGAIRFSLVGGNPNGQFILDAVTGDLRVAAPLDYESERGYRLVIRIQDLGSPPRSNTTICTIEVLDSNDNEPKFSTNMYSASLAEDVHVGYPVVQTQAYDPEGKIVYSIKNQSTTMDMIPFVIDPDSGWITTSLSLDRERQEKYDFTVLATDLGSPARSSSASVQIRVLDVNDNGPVFDQREYNVSMSEGALQGTQLLSLRAQDRDLNARLTYQIINGNPDGRFSIINQNGLGLILLTKAVHNRRAQQCELMVEVADESGKNDRVKVVVHILAANLHRPNFLNAPFRIQIPENTPTGTTVIELKAVDEDVGENGRITYSMSNDLVLSDSFRLDAETGVLTTKKVLDREMQAVYTVPVTATDHGAPALYDTTDVLIELLDVNDNIPVFLQKTYFVAVKEDLNPQTSIVQLSANDADFGLNGLVRYTFEGGNSANGTFLVDATLGIIRTNAFLDRETYSAYDLIVLAVDRGTPSLSASVTVSVKILDVNDNAPAFSADVLNFYAPENLTMGSTVAEIFASDPDEGPNAAIEYYIIGGPDADSFALVTRPNKSPPLLSNLIELDHESQKRHYKLVIRASSPPLQTDVTVNIFVTDVNDNAPVLKDFRIILNNYPRHFHHGVVGRVPVTDRDATAKLEYRITAGNRHSLLLINLTSGDIQLSATLNSDVPYSAKFTVEVSDGLNVVSAVCTLMTIPVDNKMLANSVTFQAGNLTARDLLVPATYDRLVESLSFISACSPESIFIFGIIDETDTRIPVVNISFAAAKLSGGDSNFLPPEKLKERLFVQRKLVRNMTSLEILPLDDNLCLREPCPNFEKCQAVQKFGAAPSRFITTDTFFFRSVQPVTTFDCVCPAGFTGMTVHYSCDVEINLCFSSPCGANATCVSTEGGFHCLCPEGYTGLLCEINLQTSECSDSLCKSPAVCSAGFGGRTECLGCPEDGHHTSLCELTTRSFSVDKQSYIVFPGVHSRNRFYLSLDVATTRKTGLLAYNGRFTAGADFFALEIINGSVQFSYSLGRDVGKVLVQTIIADGEWHHLEVRYFNKSARVTVDHCDHVLALEHGREIDYQCAGVTTIHLDHHCTKNGALCHRFLDLTGPLYIGGLPDAQTDSRLYARVFEGCIKDLKVDEQLLDMNNFIEEHATVAGCRQKDNLCLEGPCLNGGSCVGGWGKRHCNCPVGFSGEDCSKESVEEFHLDGDGYMLIQQTAIAVDSLDIQLEFRASKPSGILFTATAHDVTFLVIELTGQYIIVKDGYGNSAEGETRVTGGGWHKLRVTTQDGVSTIFIDGQQELEISSLPVKNRNGFSVVLGGKESTVGLTNGFTGCIRGITSSGRKASLSFRSNVQDGCSSTHHCQSAQCPGEFNHCTDTGNSYKCTCEKGYVGKECKDVCTFDPCKNGICVHSTESLHGYQCRCFANYTGDYCEDALPQACAASWWGYPLCGPCHCDVAKGFDAVCNKLTGACHCKENFYQPPHSDRCLSCDCNTKGSLDNQCDVDGQCPCRSGVVGKRCDMCPTVHGELTDNGCQNVYGSCPGSFSDDGLLWWERTEFGMVSLQPCPKSSTGTVSRTCDPSTRSWADSDTTNCSSVAFEVAEPLLEGYQSGQISMDAFVAIRIISEVRASLNATMESLQGLYVRNLHTAKELLAAVMEYELSLTGMNLTHRLDRNYLPELVECLSQVLDVSNRKLWRALQREDIRTVSYLTHLFHKYIKTVALHAEETYLRPFEIVARNLKVGVYPVAPAKNLELLLPMTYSGKSGHVQVRAAVRTAWPEFEPVSSSLAGGPGSSQLPQPLALVQARPAGQMRSEFEPLPVVFYIEYADLPALLTESPAKNHSSLPAIFSAMSRTFYFGASSIDSAGALYEFRLTGRGNTESAQCLSWDFRTRKWTTDGCATLGHNTTHVNCSCLPELLVAVMTEHHSFTNIFRLNVSVFLFSTVVLVLSVVVNFVCLIILLATRSHMDSVRVAQNIVFVALVVDVVFLLVADIVWNALICKILAALLHFFFLSRLCWCLAQSLHLYQSARNGSRDRIRFYLLLGYGIPTIIVGLSVGLRPEGYGTEGFSWMLLDDHLVMSLVGPATAIVFITMILLMTAHCVTMSKKKKDLGSFAAADLRRNFVVCTGVSMFFVSGLALAILAVNFRVAAIGYIYPLCALCQSIFMLAFLCLRTAEVGALMHEKVVWFVRRKFDSLTRSKNGKMSDSVRETYRNPGISISNSTTYRRTARPDGDISGSFGCDSSSATSTIRRMSNTRPDALLEPLNEMYTDSHKESDGTNEDTVSVHSDFTQETQRSFDILSVERTGIRSPFPNGGLNTRRANSSASTFGGPPLSSWNSLPHSARTTATPKSPSCLAGRNVGEASNVLREVPAFATFRPPSKTGQNGGHLIDTVTGELLVTGGGDSVTASQPSLIPPPEAFRTMTTQKFQDLRHTESGTAV